MENNNNMEAMDKALEMLKASQSALESAINAIRAFGNDSAPVCKIRIEIDGDGYDDEDEEDSELEPEEPAFDLVSALHEAGVHQVEDKIIVVPTAYGSAALVKPSDMNEVLSQLDEDETSDIDWVCVSIHGDTILRDDDQGDWILFVRHTDDMEDYNYVIPIDVDQYLFALHRQRHNRTVERGIKYETVDDMLTVLQILFSELLDLELPELYWKVTKPGMVCKDQQYQLHKLFTYDGIPTLHKCGYHFAANKLTLLQWYPFSKDNELYLVQVGKNKEIDEENGVGVTDSILFVEKVDWANL